MTYVSDYCVEDLVPPPEETLIVTHSIGKETDPATDFIIEGESVRVPKGYEARHATLICLFKSWESHNDYLWRAYPDTLPPAYVKVQVGNDAFVSWNSLALDRDRFAGLYERHMTLNNLTGSVPVTGGGNYVGTIAVNVMVECELTDAAMQEWQLATYQKIWTAYKRQLAVYEEKLTAASVSGGVKISGDNPEYNLSVIKDELKKSFIDVWMREGLDVLPSWTIGDPESSPPVFPNLNYTNVDANQDVLSFLDSAFDWENMSFTFMPYFLGRESRWLSRTNYRDIDPLFESFIKAGAARVRIPVNVQHTHAVLYYQLTNVIWSPYAGPVPALSSLGGPEAEIYNGYLAEVVPEEDETDMSMDEDFEEGDDGVFVLRVPTRLVHLQSSAELEPEES